MSRLAGMAILLASISIPASASVMTEDFDSVVPPGLPAGWSASNDSGSAALWASLSGAACYGGSGGCVFISEDDTVSDKLLFSPLMAAAGSIVSFSFQNRYNLEQYFDGGVLEVSINGAAYQDATGLAGFVAGSGWYDLTLSACCGNPLGGRGAWNNDSGGWLLTSGSFTVNPSDTVQFRFRLGTDDSNTYPGGGGWWIDSLSVEGAGAVPEPSTWLLVGLPLAGLLVRRSRSR